VLLRVLAAAAIGACTAWTAPAGANGRFPQSNQLIFSPVDSQLIVVRATFGLLVSRDGGSTWKWLCEGAVGYGDGGASEDPSLALTQGGALAAGTREGLSISPDTGCNWAFAGGALDKQAVVDIALRPYAPHALIALTSSYVSTTDAGQTYRSQLFESLDDGAHWAPKGSPLREDFFPTSVEVAATDPSRLYVSGAHGRGPMRTGSLLVSIDDGASWTDRPVPLDPLRENAVFIAAVDPRNADVVYTRSDSQSRLMVTDNAGGSFQVASWCTTPTSCMPSLTGLMLGFALASDNSKIYAGSVEDGLFVATRPGLAFTLQSNMSIQCLAARGTELWACSDETTSGFTVGVSANDGAAFMPKLHLASIDGPLACPTNAGATQCRPQYTALCQTLGCALLGTDGGSRGSMDGAASGGSPMPDRTARSSCGCSLLGAGPAKGGLVSVMIGLAAVRRRTRAKQRRTRGVSARRSTLRAHLRGPSSLKDARLCETEMCKPP